MQANNSLRRNGQYGDTVHFFTKVYFNKTETNLKKIKNNPAVQCNHKNKKGDYENV